jgi:peptidoglycan hydrolase-like protein with peptidoglycan-binding domain
MRKYFSLAQSDHRWSRWLSYGAIVLLSFNPDFVQRVVGQTQPPTSPSAERDPKGDRPQRPILQSGSQGAVVSELQATLKLLGYYTGSVDGLYGKSTIAAVTQFQQAAGIPVDGIVGAATWERLFPAAPGQPPLEVAPATATPPAQTPDRSEATLPILRLGMKGAAVTALQQRLQTIGLFSGAIDGVFGPETQAAVKSAQTRFGLEADGIVGAATWSALLQ